MRRRLFVVVGVWACLTRADICDRRDRRIDRGWKGDVGQLESFPGGMVRDRLQLRHRVRRFLSFPTGSVLTLTPKFTIPWKSELDGWITSSQVYAFPIDLTLPNGTLRFKGSSDYVADTGGYYGMDNMHRDDPYHHNDPSYYYYYYGDDYNGGDYYVIRRAGRALDDQRMKGFTFLQKLLDNFGLDGRECLLRAVCEVAEEPIDDLGITGELINLFFSAGYGGGTPGVEDYVMAEELGRGEGDCEARYSACPYRLLQLVQSASSFFYRGLANAGASSLTSLPSS